MEGDWTCPPNLNSWKRFRTRRASWKRKRTCPESPLRRATVAKLYLQVPSKFFAMRVGIRRTWMEREEDADDDGDYDGAVRNLSASTEKGVWSGKILKWRQRCWSFPLSRRPLARGPVENGLEMTDIPSCTDSCVAPGAWTPLSLTVEGVSSNSPRMAHEPGAHNKFMCRHSRSPDRRNESSYFVPTQAGWCA